MEELQIFNSNVKMNLEQSERQKLMENLIL